MNKKVLILVLSMISSIVLGSCTDSKADKLPNIEIVSSREDSSSFNPESLVSGDSGYSEVDSSEYPVDTYDILENLRADEEGIVESNHKSVEIEYYDSSEDILNDTQSSVDIQSEDSVKYHIYSDMISNDIEVSMKVRKVYRESNFKDFVFVNNMIADCNEVLGGAIDPNKMDGVEFAVAEVQFEITPNEDQWSINANRGYPFPDVMKVGGFDTNLHFSKKVYGYERWLETRSQGELLTTYIIYKVPKGDTNYYIEVTTEKDGTQYLSTGEQ